jgi:HEAT repeat protein
MFQFFEGCNGRRSTVLPKRIIIHLLSVVFKTIGCNKQTDEGNENWCGRPRSRVRINMHYKKPLGRFGAKPDAHDKTTPGLLQDALATFPADRVSAICAIQRLQSSDPSGLSQAAVQLLFSAQETSPALQHLARLPGPGNLLADLLTNQQVIPLEAAVTLARKLVAFDPRLDVRLVRKTIANAIDGISSIGDSDALRMLQLVDAISDCTLLGSSLVQFLRHPSEKVRSKVALMLGRSNWNQARVESLLSSDDDRLRANAVESLWGQRHEGVEEILWSATQDHCARVVANALLGLCQLGNGAAHLQLAALGDSPDSELRSSAAWAMGEIADPQFDAALEKLEQDPDAKVREIAENGRKKLRVADPGGSPLPETAAEPGLTVEVEDGRVPESIEVAESVES